MKLNNELKNTEYKWSDTQTTTNVLAALAKYHKETISSYKATKMISDKTYKTKFNLVWDELQALIESEELLSSDTPKERTDVLATKPDIDTLAALTATVAALREEVKVLSTSTRTPTYAHAH